MGVRVRLRFDSSPLHYSRQCWFLFDPESCSVVSDVVFLIARHFSLREEGLQLYMDGYLLPAKESVQIIRDNDTLQVRAAPYSESSEDETPPAKRRKGTAKVKTVKRSHTQDNEASPEESPSARRRRKRRREAESEGTKLKKGATLKEMNPSKQMPVKEGSSKIQQASAAKSKGTLLHINSTSTSTQKSDTLHPVISKLPSGALHTVFRSSSSSSSSESESSEPTEVWTTQQPRPPPSIAKSPRETQWDKRLPKVVDHAHRTRTPPASFSGRKRKFPSVVGGASDVLTTKSVIYKRQDDSVAESGLLTGKVDEQPTIEAGSQTSSVSTAAEKARAAQVLETVDTLERGPVSVSGISPGSKGGEEVEEGEGARDYSKLSELSGAPRVGDVIAFKILELSSSYTPEPSDYKEATVLAFNESSKSVRLKYTEATTKREREKAVKESLGKFALQDEADKDIGVAAEVEICTDLMLESRLVC